MDERERERDAPFRLHGQRAVVTGASRGIGAAIAAGLARAGADIIAIQRGAESADTRTAVEAWGQTYTSVPYDLNETEGIPAFVEGIEAGTWPRGYPRQRGGGDRAASAGGFPASRHGKR